LCATPLANWSISWHTELIIKTVYMKIVKVQYTTSAAYAATNQAHIQAIAREVQQLNHPGIRYQAYLLADGKTFVHLDFFENEAAHETLQQLSSFRTFDERLWASDLEVEPKLELLSLVATSASLTL
jgi:hypothetical protein